MNVNLVYEENIPINIQRAFDLSLQWLKGTHKAKIKKFTSPTYIEAKQGTMMTNSGHDPNWKKRIRMSFYDIEGKQTLLRLQASPLSRNVIRVQKLKRSWYDGLFFQLFSLLQSVGVQTNEKEITTKICQYCGAKIEEKLETCPKCNTQLI
ncbi:MAG: hypothetical protein EU533_06880 [Promethearchaeota archaeon]|nr:MAG: hypothetical protein EU533_06880 [Candidatus Lokiarchaeota archaeon]